MTDQNTTYDPVTKGEEQKEQQQQQQKEKPVSEDQKQNGKESNKAEEEKKAETEQQKERKYKNHCQQFEIVHEVSYNSGGPSEIVLREFSSIACDGSAIVVGFPRSSRGDMLASGTAQFIVQQLDLPLVGDICSPSFPSVAMIKQSTPHNSVRIYGNKRIVVIVSDLDIKDPVMEHGMVRAIYEFARRHRCTMIISVDAVAMDSRTLKLVTGEIDENAFALGKDADPGTPVPKSREELLTLLSAANNDKSDKSKDSGEGLLFVTNRENLADKLEEMGHRPAVNNMNVVGILGGLMAEMAFSRTPVVSLFALLKPTQIIATSATITLVHAIDKLLGRELLIDTSQLVKVGRELQGKVKDVLKDIQEKEMGKRAMSHMYT